MNFLQVLLFLSILIGLFLACDVAISFSENQIIKRNKAEIQAFRCTPPDTTATIVKPPYDWSKEEAA